MGKSRDTTNTVQIEKIYRVGLIPTPATKLYLSLAQPVRALGPEPRSRWLKSNTGDQNTECRLNWPVAAFGALNMQVRFLSLRPIFKRI